MAHKCKCAICGEEFDRDTIQAVKHGTRRYAHQKCYPQGELVPLKEKSINKQIIEYLVKVYGKDEVNYPLVGTHIKKFVEQGYKETGILAALHWWYDIQGHSPARDENKNKNGGIGIIPYIYPQAKEYYAKIKKAQMNNMNKDYTRKDKVIKIKLVPPQKNQTFFESIEKGEINEQESII